MGAGGFKTVSSGYRDQLQNLMKTLNATSPHFIRCIVPNETKTPGVLDAALVMHQLTCNGVLEGIRICRKGFPNRIPYPDFKHRYKVLNAQACENEPDNKKAATETLQSAGLDAEKYRVGKTKVSFRAGVLGELEEIRDERLGRIIAWIQAFIRGRLARVRFAEIQAQRNSVLVLQRTWRKYFRLKNWAWFRLWSKVKPLLSGTRIEDEIAKLDERATKACEDLAAEVAAKENLENRNASLIAEKAELLVTLESCKGKAIEFVERQTKLTCQRDELEVQISDLSKKLRAEEEARLKLVQDSKQGQHEACNFKKDIEDMELTVQKGENEKATKDHSIRSLNDEIAHQDELINKANKEKKIFQETNQKNAEELQGVEDKCNHQIKEAQAKVEELEEEVEHERQARAKTEKAKAKLVKELTDLGDRLDEAGGATAAQMELNKKRDSELARLRRDLEESNIQHEATLASLRKKHNDAVAEMAEQVDHLNKMKARIEKDKETMKRDMDDARSATDNLSRDKAAAEKVNKQIMNQINDTQSKLDEANRTLNDFDATKKKLTVENAELLHQLEEVESQNSQLAKMKLTLGAQLDDTSKMAEDEGRERAVILGKFRNLEHDIDGLREQLDEEGEAKADTQRQLSKASADAQMWRSKYETEGIARVEELEGERLKLIARLEEAEQSVEQLNIKNVGLEKNRQRITAELEDVQMEVERAQAIASAAEKRQRSFDKLVGEWKLKVDDLSAELDSSQKECRNYSTELFRVKAAYEENMEQLDSVRRENKNLADE